GLGGHLDRRLGKGEVTPVAVAHDEGGDDGGAGVLPQKRGGAGKLDRLAEERDRRAAPHVRPVDEHGDAFAALEDLDHLDEGELAARTDLDGLDAGAAPRLVAPAGEPGARLLERDDGE